MSAGSGAEAAPVMRGSVTAAFAALRAALAKDTSLLVATTGAAAVLRVVNTMVLTRILAPDVFGMVGAILTVCLVFTMVSDLGFQVYVVRHERGLERRFLDVIWTVQVVRGFVLTALAVAAAGPIAALFAKPELAAPLAVASVNLLLLGLSSMSPATGLRTGLTRRLVWFDFWLLLVQLGVGLLLALVLRNVWAIVASMLVSTALRTAGSYLLFPGARRRLAFDRRTVAEFWAFSRVILTSSTLTLLIQQSDKLALARLFDLTTFGVYVIAAGLAAAPAAFVHAYAGKLLYPRYAALWRDAPERFAREWYGMKRKVSLLYALAMGGLIGGAPLVIAILYDPRYAGAATYLSILALAPALAMATQAAADALVARGHVRTTLAANVARVGWIALAGPPAFLLLGPIGLVAVIGLIEAPPYLYLAWRLRREGMFDAREEALLWLALGVGVALGAPVAFSAHSLFPGL